MTTDELVRLVELVFRPRPEDRRLALLVDLPDDALPDNEEWRQRRLMVVDWHRRFSEAADRLGLEGASLVFYPNVRSNNADLPRSAAIHEGGTPPERAEELRGASIPTVKILSEHQIVIAATELSATAPLKLMAPELGFRAATMPGFSPEMLPALKLDYEEIDRRCKEIKELLDRAVAARMLFEAAGESCELTLDLRHRRATASGGLVREPGKAGNLPSGETYIVPYEGEHAGDPSLTAGLLPVELEGELLFYRIEGNRVREVLGKGARTERERREMEAEPAYGNVAELGLGLLADYGIKPAGKLLLDEKLGLHIAFGRSDHFGGQVGAKDFSSPEKVVHIDRVYTPEMQPRIKVLEVDLENDDGAGRGNRPLMRDGRYV
jgi:leucyl aminopeptidase (aminopeptidase T)